MVDGLPVLHFEGASYIAAVHDPDSYPCDPDEPNECQEMDLHLEVSVEIEGVLSKPPGKRWYTGDVDLHYKGYKGCLMEVIGADVCNVWFTDVPEPRCLKYWRNLVFDGQGGAILVDDHDNHVPNPLNGAGEAYPEAMYVRYDLRAHDLSSLNLNGHRIYYGRDVEAGGILNGSPIELILTVFGDFNGDCYVDGLDKAIFQANKTKPGEISDYPLADYDGDCDVDLKDLDAFKANYGTVPADIPQCNESLALDCPEWLFGGGESAAGGPSFPAALSAEEEEAMLAEALLDFATHETVGEDEQSQLDFVLFMQEATDWVRGELPQAQRVALANALENAGVTFAAPIAAELAPSVAATLRE